MVTNVMGQIFGPTNGDWVNEGFLQENVSP